MYCTQHTKLALEFINRHVDALQNFTQYRLREIIQIDAIKLKQVVAGEAPSGRHCEARVEYRLYALAWQT